MKNQGGNGRADAGYAMAALLVSIAVMGILMSVAMPSWKALVQREREDELVFRGEQYARAVGLFQRKYAGAFPPSLDVLLQQKFLRKKYKDPMAEDGEFQIIYQNSLMSVPGQVPGGGAPRPGMLPQQQAAPGLVPVESETGNRTGLSGGGRSGLTTGAPGTAGPRGGIVGVASKSTKSSYRLYKGRGKYNEWQFVYTQASQRVGAPGTVPGQPGGASRPGMGPGAGGNPPGGGFSRPFGSGTSTRPGGPSFPRTPPD
ncbi:MAG: type II secretion system protein [Acidobacteria bacterium]|nr:type II secretion system protein [Acidobacteriota bacterium]